MGRGTVVLAGLACALLSAWPAVAQVAPAPVEFLQADLRLAPGSTATVQVVVVTSVAPTDLEVQVVGVDGVTAEVTEVDLEPGGTSTISVHAPRDATGTGEVVAIATPGSVARLPLTVERSGATEVPIDRLVLGGWRLLPFGGGVRVGGVVVDGAPGGDGATAYVTSADGDIGRVVRSGDRFDAVGIDASGVYSGTVDLAPGQPGGDVELEVRVRDIPAYALAVLLLGLWITDRLDGFGRRTRPRLVLATKVRRIAERAASAEREAQSALDASPLALDPAPVAWRATGTPPAPNGLIDGLAADVLAAWDGTLDRSKALEEATAALTAMGAMCVRVSALHDGQASVLRRWTALVSSARRAGVADGGLPSPLASALRPAPSLLRAPIDLADAERTGKLAVAHLDALEPVVATLIGLCRAADAHAAPARALLGEALTADTVDKAMTDQVVALHAEHLADRRAGGLPIDDEIGDLALVPEADDRPASDAPPPDPGADRRPRLLALVAAAAVLAIALASTFSLGGSDEAAVPSTLTVPDIVDVSTSTALASSTTSTTGLGADSEPERLDLVATNVFVVAGIIAVAVGAGQARRLRPQPSSSAPTAASLEAELDRHDRRFRLFSGVVVAVSGMVALYLPEPGFGSFADYATVLLWGTTVGEGLKLARRLLPPGGAIAA
jgi:hypothetical protein